MRSIAGIPARRNGVWSSRIVVCTRRREDGARRRRSRAAARICDHSGSLRAALARQPQPAVGDVVEQHHLRATWPRWAFTYAFDPRSASV